MTAPNAVTPLQMQNFSWLSTKFSFRSKYISGHRAVCISLNSQMDQKRLREGWFWGPFHGLVLGTRFESVVTSFVLGPVDLALNSVRCNCGYFLKIL